MTMLERLVYTVREGVRTDNPMMEVFKACCEKLGQSHKQSYGKGDVTWKTARGYEPGAGLQQLESDDKEKLNGTKPTAVDALSSATTATSLGFCRMDLADNQSATHMRGQMHMVSPRFHIIER